MAFPYSSGDVLTAADLNQSSGLVLVKTVSIGSGVSSVTVTDAFSATFDNYHILLSGAVCTTDNTFFLTYGSSVTGYYGKAIFGSFLSSGVSTDQDNNNVRHTYVVAEIQTRHKSSYTSSTPSYLFRRKCGHG